jgi:hypothetical protein
MSIKGDIVATDIPTGQLAKHICDQHNFVVGQWLEAERWR